MSSFACTKTQSSDSKLLATLLHSDPFFQPYIQNLDKYEIQIVYTQVNRDAQNRPSFISYEFNVDTARYFYPASTVKLPVALLALEKLNKLQIKGLLKHTPMYTDSASQFQQKVYADPSSENGLPSIAQYIKRIFLVSDNEAYNRLFEFIGQDALNDALEQKGYTARISHRVGVALPKEEQGFTNPIRFESNGQLIYRQEAHRSTYDFTRTESILKGRGYTNAQDELINNPFDFTYKNEISLTALHSILKAVIFPEASPLAQRFDLTEDDYRMLYQYLSQLPSESIFPKYDTSEYYDSYVKFLQFGANKKSMPKHIRVFNKVGNAYGYLIDNAYVVDHENKIEYFLSAVIHVNENQIYNDGIYEYEKEGFPFLHQLGQLIYNYELKRKRAFSPDLSKFELVYDDQKQAKIIKKNALNLLNKHYLNFHQSQLDYRRIKHAEITTELEKLKSNPVFKINIVGQSAEGREISMVEYGKGPTKVLLWSQMHGNESTATRALFEVFNFLKSEDEYNEFRQKLTDSLTIYFLPMLNPDGAEVYKRRTAFDIDMNRDALRLQCPESQLLKSLRDRLEPHFGFNLHDQGRNYNVSGTANPATISFLAPAFNEAKDINSVRANAMKVIAELNEFLQVYIPAHVGKYDDTFEPRAFGDNIQKWGTSTILIESGGYRNDREKKTIVKMNFLTILKGLESIAERSYEGQALANYDAIPFNDTRMLDLIIRNVLVELNGKLVKMDVGINQEEIEDPTQALGFYSLARVHDLGDLSTYVGYEEINAEGMVLKVADESMIYTTFNQNNAPDFSKKLESNTHPIIAIGTHADFVLVRDQQLYYTIANGTVYNWSTRFNPAFKNEKINN